MIFSSDKPLVSVIILCYNQNNIVGRAIESVLNQTYENIQLVIVDDCSKDNSKQVIEEWRTRFPDKIKTYIQPVNVGHPANMNTGYKLCDGELVTFCDGDDRLFPRSVEVQVDFLRSNPDFDVVFTNFTFSDMDGNTINEWATDKHIIPSGDILPDLFSLNYPGNVHPHFEMTSKRIIEEIGFYDESIPIWVDWDFRLRLAAKYKCGYCSYVGNSYTLHSSGLTTTLKRETYLKFLVKVANKNLELLDKYPPHVKKRTLKKIKRNIDRMSLALNVDQEQDTFFETLSFLWKYPSELSNPRFVMNSLLGKKRLGQLAALKRRFK